MTANALRPTTHLLYLHGFRSSPQSFKARRVQAWLSEHHPDVRFWCPQLPPSPRDAMVEVAQGVSGWPADTSAVMGSSLGGFYAHVVAGAPGRETWRCVVLNPAVAPARDLAAYIGEQRHFHDPARYFHFRPEFVDELRAMAPGPLQHPERCLALLAKGDEVLDWREMSRHFAEARQILLEGSDHALSDFDDHLTCLMRFLHLCD